MRVNPHGMTAIRHRMLADNPVRVLFGMTWAEFFIATPKEHNWLFSEIHFFKKEAQRMENVN